MHTAQRIDRIQTIHKVTKQPCVVLRVITADNKVVRLVTQRSWEDLKAEAQKDRDALMANIRFLVHPEFGEYAIISNNKTLDSI